MTHRAQVIIPAVSAIPEDAVTNTFHFQVDPGGVSAALSALDTALIAFYTTTSTTGLASFLSADRSRVTNACSIRWYNLDEASPRVPVRTTSWTLTGTAPSGGLPQEVAIALSFQAIKVSGVNQARRRGRIFIGPLADAAATVTSGVSRPNTTFITRANLCMQALKSAAIAANSPWSVWSPTNNTPASVNDGWVDNAFDTQRRRGVAPTVRTAWT